MWTVWLGIPVVSRGVSLQLTQLKSLWEIAEGEDRTENPSPPHETQFLVLASLHGAGTTTLSDAIAEHPCIIDVGEPFSNIEKLWNPSDNPLGKMHEEFALFRNHSDPDPTGTFNKLQDALDRRGLGVRLDPALHMQTGSITSFFKAVREAACANYNLVDACKGRCIFSHKLFPDYVGNEFAKSNIADYLTRQGVAVVHLMRNEDDIVDANVRRFHAYAKWKPPRDDEWNAFLEELGKAAKQDGRIWEPIHAENIFPSVEAYMVPLKRLFHELDMDEEFLLAPVRHVVEVRFSELLAQGHLAR